MRLHFPFRRHTHTAHIRLNTAACKACWACVAACPRKVLGKVDVLGHRHARIDRAEQCAGCLRCVKACPHGAIVREPTSANASGVPGNRCGVRFAGCGNSAPRTPHSAPITASNTACENTRDTRPVLINLSAPPAGHKKRLNRAVDVALLILLLLATLSGCVDDERHGARAARSAAGQEAPAARPLPGTVTGTADPFHILTGGLLVAGVAVHLGLHAGWIRAVVLRWPARLAPHARALRAVDVVLAVAITACAATGLAAWLAPARPSAALHTLSAVVLCLALAVHLALHTRR